MKTGINFVRCNCSSAEAHNRRDKAYLEALERSGKKTYDIFHDRAKVSFGIAAFCSNDTCEEALNIVIKLQTVNGRAVAKLSDTPGKAMCRDENYLKYLKESVAFRLEREK